MQILHGKEAAGRFLPANSQKMRISTKSYIVGAAFGVLVGGSLMLGGVAPVQAEEVASQPDTNAEAPAQPTGTDRAAGERAASKPVTHTAPKLTKEQFENQFLGHYDGSVFGRYETKSYLMDEEEMRRHVFVEAITDEDDEYKQTWRITYNDKNFWMDDSRTPYNGSDYNSGGYKANPYIGLVMSDDLELDGDVTIQVHGRKIDSNEPDGTTSTYVGPLETKYSQEYWTDPVYPNGGNAGRLQGAIRMDRERNLTLGTDNIEDLKFVLNDDRDNNAFFRFGYIEKDPGVRGTGASHTLMNDAGLIFSTYLYTSKDPSYIAKNSWVTMEFTTKRDPGRFYEGEHATYVAGFYNSYDWNGKDVRVFMKQFLHSDAKDVDSDGDGLTDRLEYFLQSDPNNPDTDGDGKKDGDVDKNGNGDVKKWDKPLLTVYDGMYKVSGTDPTVAPPTLPDRKFFGIPGEIIEGEATPNSVVAIYPYANGERAAEAIGEAIADENGHYKIVIGKVFKRRADEGLQGYNKYNNTIILEGENDEPIDGRFVAKMKDRKPVIPEGSELELTSWSDGFDGRPLFSHPELAIERGKLVDKNDPFKDFELTPKEEVDDKDHLTPDDKDDVKDKIVNNEDLKDVIKGDDENTRGNNIVVKDNGDVEITLKDDSKVTIPGDKVVTEKVVPHGSLTLEPQTPAQDEPAKPAEGTPIKIGGKVTNKTEDGDPLKERDLTVVIKTGNGPEQTVEAKTDENGNIVSKDGSPLTTPAGNVGETTTVKVYDGSATTGNPLTESSITAGKDPSKVGVPNIEEGNNRSTVEVTGGQVPADGTSTHTITIMLKDKYGDPITGAKDKLILTNKDGNAQVGEVVEGQNGSYTVTVTATTPGTPEISVTYNNNGSNITLPGSPVHPEFSRVIPGAPQKPGLEAPQEGTTTVVVTPPTGEVTTIKLEVPGNPDITLTNKGDGTWTADGGATAKVGENGKITVTVPSPIQPGNVTAEASNEGGTSPKESVQVTPAPVVPHANLTLTPETPAQDEPAKPAEGTPIKIGGKVTNKTEDGDPLKERDLTVVIKTGNGPEQTVPAKTDENGNIVSKDGSPLTTPAGNVGETTTVKVYDGTSASGDPLTEGSITAGKDPSKTSIPNIEAGDHQSNAEVDGDPVPADGNTPHTITVTLVNKYGDPITGAKDKIQLTSDDNTLVVGNPVEGQNGTYTVTITSTTPGTPNVTVKYKDGDTELTIPGSPLQPVFSEVETPAPAKPVVPEITAPTEGDTELKLNPPAEDVTKIEAKIPGNGTITIEKGKDGNWSVPGKPEIKVEDKDGKLVIGPLQPINKGEIEVTVEKGDGTKSDPKKVTVQDKDDAQSGQPDTGTGNGGSLNGGTSGSGLGDDSSSKSKLDHAQSIKGKTLPKTGDSSSTGLAAALAMLSGMVFALRKKFLKDED